jgi:type IV pilus assembly protein PilB
MPKTEIVRVLQPEADALRLISPDRARKYQSVPIRRDSSRLFVAMSNPSDLAAIEEIEFMTGLRVEPVASTQVEIERAIQRHFGSRQLPALVRPEEPDEEPEPPVIRIQRALFREAIRSGASDIHIDPGARWTRVRYRVDGALEARFDIPRWLHSRLIARIKIMGKLDISERRIPQDGLLLDPDLGIEARLSTLPTHRGEAAVIRIFRDQRQSPTLASLGGGDSVETRLKAICHRSQGILIVAGPTGSGKTTTLYAVVDQLRRRPQNIVTIEDPVEYRVDGVRQVQVDTRSKLTFASALRATLRQDPDVILVGEIRDVETARIAFDAALTGHLVLSTLHATNAISVLLRLTELGLDPHVVSTALIGAVAQRLIRKNCPACLRPDSPPQFYLDRLRIAPSEHAGLGRSEGCHDCDFTGISGRIPFFEILELNGRTRHHLVHGSEDALRKEASKSGFRTILDQVLEKVRVGEVSADEAYRTCYFGEES